MANWKYTLKIKHLLLNDDPKQSYQVSQKLAQEIKKFAANNIINDENLYLEFKDLAEAFEDIKDTGDVTGEVNTMLDELYDACDYNLVWVE